MPRIIACPEEDAITLPELIEALNDPHFDPADEDSFAAAGPLLKRLANNRGFLAEIALAELKDRCHGQSATNRYSSQVLMLHQASAKFYIRANFWPSPKDSVFRTSGTSPFFYHVPHDHNFSFLTVGYLGPGYWSDYYEYDYESVVGIPGEVVDLKFVEKSRLEPGKVMLYRAHRDVHDQLPADDMSISINIMHAAPSLLFLSQYRFDVQEKKIAGILSRTSAEALLALAAHHGGGNGRDLVEGFAAHHPCDRLQFAALRELAAAEPDVDAQLERLGRGRDSANAFVAAMSALEARRLAAHRHWIER
ncbi:MAG TPA: transposase [Allosphingosinicella sp.]|nr:transposase [Allosphingosinicella sp.]